MAKPLEPERVRKQLLVSTVVGIVVWAGFALAAAAMLVSLGAWAWVVYPFAIYWWSGHTAKAVTLYQKAFKPQQKWEQNVTFNVSSDLTEEQIAAAVERAVNVDLQYGR